MLRQFDDLLGRKPSSLESIHIARNDRDRGYPFQLLDDLALPNASGLEDVLTPAR